MRSLYEEEAPPAPTRKYAVEGSRTVTVSVKLMNPRSGGCNHAVSTMAAVMLTKFQLDMEFSALAPGRSSMYNMAAQRAR